MIQNPSDSIARPLISVLMAAFNAEPHIAEAINSILKQTYSHFELIILNDGSMDNTQNILDSFTDARIKTLQHSQNLGLIQTRNELVAAANGKYIALMDADDIAHPKRLEQQIALLEKSNVDICGTDYYSLYEDTRRRKRSKQPHTNSDIRALMVVYSPLCNPTITGRADLFHRHPYQNGIDVAEDYALWQQLSIDGARFTNIKSPLLTYRIHHKQTSQALQNKTQIISTNLQKKYCKALGIDEALKPTPCAWWKRIAKAPRFLFLLNRQIPDISVFANWQIYARFQQRNNGLFTPLTRMERLVMALIASVIGKLPNPKNKAH